jgi:hypothetical protein
VDQCAWGGCPRPAAPPSVRPSPNSACSHTLLVRGNSRRGHPVAVCSGRPVFVSLGRSAWSCGQRPHSPSASWCHFVGGRSAPVDRARVLPSAPRAIPELRTRASRSAPEAAVGGALNAPRRDRRSVSKAGAATRRSGPATLAAWTSSDSSPPACTDCSIDNGAAISGPPSPDCSFRREAITAGRRRRQSTALALIVPTGTVALAHRRGWQRRRRFGRCVESRFHAQRSLPISWLPRSSEARSAYARPRFCRPARGPRFRRWLSGKGVTSGGFKLRPFRPATEFHRV